MSHEPNFISEPRRLVDDPSLAAEVRRDLRHYAAIPTASVALAFDVEHGLSRLQSTLLDPQAGAHLAGLDQGVGWQTGALSGAGGGVPALATGQAGGQTIGLLGALSSKMVVLGLTLSVGAGAVYWQQHSPSPLVHEHEPSARTEPALTPVVEASPANAIAPPPLPETVQVPLGSARVHNNAAKVTSASSRKVAADPRDEAKLIARARQELEEHPQAALTTLEEARHRFPHGALVQERAGLRVLALFALDRHGLARREAQKYLERYPNGPLASRIREGLTP